MSNKHYITFDEAKQSIHNLCKTIEADGFIPDIIVPIVRGGTMPGVMMSHYFNVPVACVHWTTRSDYEVDDEALLGNESNCWLPELALKGHKILIVEDILDTGRTMVEIKEDWQASVRDPLPWGSGIKIACLQQRYTSGIDADYTAQMVDDDLWIVYPWEEF